MRLRAAMLLLTAAAMLPSSPWAVAQDDPPQAAPGKEAEQYSKTLVEWRAMLSQLRETQVRYQNAGTDAESAEIEKQWHEQLEKGEQLLGRLRNDAVAAYRVAPGEDEGLSRLLHKMLQDDVDSDRYEDAYEVAVAITEQEGAPDEVLGMAGTVFFQLNEFDRAERVFGLVKNAGQLSRETQRWMELTPEYKKLWADEQVARKRDAESNLPQVMLKTNRGEIVIELFENEAPGAVGNFISLVNQKYYDGLTFHRVIKSFMAQGGCPDGTGGGGPGYKIYCECHQPNHRKHFRGTLSMAHAGRDSGGSQFFLTFVATEHLNGAHTAFGRVVKGMDVLAKIRRREPGAKEPPDRIMEAGVIRSDPNKTYEPNKVQ